MHPEAGSDLDWFLTMRLNLFDQFVMGNLSILWEVIHTLFQFGLYVSTIYLVMKVVCLHELFGLHFHTHVFYYWCGYDAITM